MRTRSSGLEFLRGRVDSARGIGQEQLDQFRPGQQRCFSRSTTWITAPRPVAPLNNSISSSEKPSREQFQKSGKDHFLHGYRAAYSPDLLTRSLRSRATSTSL